MTTRKTMIEPAFDWSEPEGCSTPRGWCSVTQATHPDRKSYGFDYFRDVCGGLGVGNYLTYQGDSFSSRGPNGERIHAVAYFHHVATNGCAQDVRIGWSWCHTVEEAKAFIE